MSKMLSQLLAPDNLTGIIQTNVNGVPEDILPSGFFTVTGRFSGNQGRYNKVAGTQNTATVQNYGAPARMVNKWGISTQPVTLLHAFESIAFDPADLVNLMAEDRPIQQQMGRQTVERNLANFAQRFRNLRISAVMSALATGYIYADGSGNLLPSSSGAVISVDYGVAAGHKDQIGGIIGASWATAGTDIAGDIEAIQANSIQTTGKVLKYAFYGDAVAGYLGGNTNIGALIHASPALSEQMARQSVGIPQGLLGLTWIPAGRSFFRDQTDTVRSWVDSDHVILTPEPSADWWGFLEGSYLVPRSIDLSSDAMSGLGDLQEVMGPFSFATKSVNPPGLVQYSGDTFLPVLTNPDAIYIADVVP